MKTIDRVNVVKKTISIPMLNETHAFHSFDDDMAWILLNEVWEAFMDAFKVEHMTDDVIREIAGAYLDYGFREGEESLFNLLGSREDILRYQMASLKIALESGWIWAVGENREAYIAITPPSWKPPLFLILRFPFVVMKSVRPKAMLRLMKLVRKAGPSIADMMRREKKTFLHVAMLCVRKPYQGKGYMRKALDVAKRMADEKNIPLVLETDESLKVAKYRHLGLELEKVRQITPTMTLYDMVYHPAKAIHRQDTL